MTRSKHRLGSAAFSNGAKASDLPDRNVAITVNAPFDFVNALARRLADESVQAIASADYGYRADDVRRLLERIKAGHAAEVLTEADGTLREVLELTRWSDAGDAASELRRLFACSCLLAANGFDWPLTATMAIAVESALALSMHDEFQRFVETLVPVDPEAPDAQLPLLASVVLAAARRDQTPVKSAAARLLESAANWAVPLMSEHQASRWLVLMEGASLWPEAPHELRALAERLRAAQR